jgi:hypothetical protein
MTRIRDVWNKAVDYAGDVIQGGVNLVTAPSIGAAVNSAKTGYVQSVDRNNDGVVSPWEGLRSWMIGVPANVVNTLAYTGDPSRGTTMPQAQYVPTGNSVFGNSMGLDSYGFFANAPQGVDSALHNQWLSYNTTPLSSFGQLMAPQYGQLPDLSNNAWYTGTGAGSMGLVPPAPEAPVQAPVPTVAPTAPSTTISGIMGANKPTPVQYPNNAVAMYNAAPMMSKADMNAIAAKSEMANYLTNPDSRTISHTSIAQRFNPLAGHEAHVRKMDLAKYANELSPTRALEDAQFNQEMAMKLANMAQ